jgi:hypothetical protein
MMSDNDDNVFALIFGQPELFTPHTEMDGWQRLASDVVHVSFLTQEQKQIQFLKRVLCFLEYHMMDKVQKFSSSERAYKFISVQKNSFIN